jgi:hypothetical protein
MALRRQLVFLLATTLASLAARHRSPNFVVDAANARVAQQVAEAAERYRKEKAVLWLGYEMPNWPEPCPLKVTLKVNEPGGATQFLFDQGRVLSQKMDISGPLDRLLASVLPHEVTHTVFAFYFRVPVPRWADEGGSVLSEDDLERARHDHLVREILNSHGRAMPLRRLFTLRDYPNDVMVLYAEGFSVSQFLVERRDRQTFLKFIWQGMHEDWDRAVQTHYGFRTVEELEHAWLTHLSQTRRQPMELARNNPGRPANPASLWAQNTQADQGQRVIVRQTVPPSQPTLAAPAPVFRGQAPDDTASVGARPGYLPDVPVSRPAAPSWAGTRDPWRPASAAANPPPPPFRLGTPEAITPEPAAPAPPLPPPPIGYPR